MFYCKSFSALARVSSGFVLLLLLHASMLHANQMVVSPIGSQQVLAGGKIDIYFAAFDPNVSGVLFTSDDLPPFAEIINNGDNTGRIAVNTSPGQEGEYLFHLQVAGTAGSSVVPVHLRVLDRNQGGTIYYCDPVNGSMANPGDSLHPWGGLEQLFATNPSFEAGDIIFLRDGYHGFPQIKGENAGRVYIAAQANHTPKVKKLNFMVSANWVLSGLEISPEAAGVTELGDYLNMVAYAKNITIENCHIYGIKSSAVWTDNQAWYDNCGNGILNRGKLNVIRNNLITNTYFSVTIDGENNHFDYNIIDRFGGDAIRGLKSYNTFNYNVVMNAVVDDYETGNHDDVFQSWTFNSPIKSIEIKGNVVFSCTDPDLPLKTSVLQGIVMFDGYSEDWVVENNLVVIDHAHGIALYGAKNCKIVNNTVIRNPLELFYYGSHPWIRINNHKDGGVSTGNLVRNNFSGAMVLESVPGTDDYNSVSTDYDTYLTDYDSWDFHLNAASPAINSGLVEDAPTTDLERLVRLPAGDPDRGCFEKEAAVFDFEDPAAPGQLKVIETMVSAIVLSWDAAADNTGISYYRISYDQREEITTGTEFAVYNLQNDSSYDFEVTAIDYSGNVSETVTVSATTDPLPVDGFYELTVGAHRHDHQIRSTNKLEWVGLHEHHVGAVTGTYDASAVIPFRLPLLGETEEVKSAELKIRFKGFNNSPQSSVDLYGLPARSRSDVLAGDHWQGGYGESENGTGLVPHLISPSSTPGFIDADTSASMAIAAYINGEYEAGAGAGDYIFFRLNSGAGDETPGNYYRLSSTDETDSNHRPSLALTIGSKETSAGEKFTTAPALKVFPNPAGSGQSFTVEIAGSELPGNGRVLVHDYLGRLLFEEPVDQQTTKFTITLGMVKLHPGTYILSIRGGSFVSRTLVIIQ
ncbi:MAG: T9SS type A sorting domain-containing protein [Bacteroidota bacterium]